MTITTLTSLGAVSDARELRDVEMTATSTTLTSASAPFASTDVGKAIVVGGAGGGSTKLISSIAGYTSPTEVELAHPAATTVTNAGAVFGTDCSAPLQDALNFLASNKGGRLIVDGLFLLASPVALDFGGETAGVSVEIVGTGSDSAIWIGVPGSSDAITLGSAKLAIRDVNFIGAPGASMDARRVLNFPGLTARIEGCGFYGLFALQGIVYADGCDLEPYDCDFGGSFVGGGNSVIENKNWYGFSGRRLRFYDYGNFRGLHYSKSGNSATMGWVRADTPIATEGARGHGVFRLADMIWDEGAIHGVIVKPTTGRITHVHLSGLRQNVNSVEGSRGLHIEKVDTVVYAHSRVGLATTPATLAAHFQDCTTALVDSLETDNGVTKISATNVAALTIKDSPGITSLTLVNTGFHPVDSRYMPFAIVKEGPVSDADFLAPPAPGTMGLDKTPGASKVQVKRVAAAGGWISNDLPGGDVYGTEINPNWSFTENSTEGWLTAYNSTLSIVNESLRVTNTGANGRGYRVLPTTVGQKYRVEVTGGAGTVSRLVRIGKTQGEANYFQWGSAGGSGTFTATGPNVVITLMLDGGTAGTYGEFGSVSLKPA